jgi:hypothetical protein
MTALDVSHLVEASSDPPELRAFKQLVYERAQRGKSAYGFCAQIDRELEILGIKKEKQVAVKVTTSHPFIFEVKVHPSKLLDKSEEEQKAEIITLMGELSISGNGMRATRIQLPANCIVSMELVTKESSSPPPGGGREARTNREWAYLTAEGRVLHEVPNAEARRDEARYIRATCGQETYGSLINTTSPRGENRHCAKCERH